MAHGDVYRARRRALRAHLAAAADADLARGSNEQNLTNLPLAVVLLGTKSNDIDEIRPQLPNLMRVLTTLTPKQLVRIGV